MKVEEVNYVNKNENNSDKEILEKEMDYKVNEKLCHSKKNIKEV